jgi:hypothetical protein
MMTWLLFSGFVRSLEFTDLNAIVFADIDASKMSRAVSFSSAAQQLLLSVGVAPGGHALQGFALLNPGARFSRSKISNGPLLRWQLSQ